MKWGLLLVLCACGSKSVPEVPADHQLHRTGSNGDVKIDGKAVPLASLVTKEDLGLPVSGVVDVAIDVKHLDDDPAKANGTIRITCTGCTIGDDKTKLSIGKKTSFGGDLDFGHLDLGRITIAVDVVDGKATVSTFDVASNDVTLELAGSVALQKPLAKSRIDLCLRFAATPALTKRDPKMDAIIQTTGASRASDGLFNIKLTDKLGDMRRLAVICDGSAPPESAPMTAAAVPDVPDPPAALDKPELSDEATAKLLDGLVKPTSATTFEVDTAKWAAIVANPMIAAKGARVVPSMKDGKAQGFKLYAIKPGSLFALLGLQNGDTIIEINGWPLTTAEQALETFTKVHDLGKGAHVELDILRKGAPVALRYTLS